MEVDPPQKEEEGEEGEGPRVSTEGASLQPVAIMSVEVRRALGWFFGAQTFSRRRKWCVA